jgi:hypothetical protein
VVSSVGIAALIGHVAFWVLVVWAYLTDSLSPRASVIFALLWLVPNVLLSFVPSAGPFFSPYVAVLDIVLVFLLFHGDVRLT